MQNKLSKFVFSHKIMSGVILLMIIFSGYLGYQALTKNKSVVRYATAAVGKGTLIVSISGSGQVSSSSQIDIKSKNSGDIAYLKIKNGQEVKTGALLAQIDSRKAQKAVADAETALETAKLELEELLKPADAYSLMQAENALVQTKDNLTKLKFAQESNYQDSQDAIKKAEDNLEKTYEDSFNAISNAFLDLPTLITGLRDILHSYEIAKSEIVILDSWENESVYLNSFRSEDRYKVEPFIASAESGYRKVRENYDQNLEDYKKTSRYSDHDIIELLLDQTIETTRLTAESVKNEANLLDFVADYFSDHNWPVYNKITEYQTDLKSYTSKTNSHLSSLLSSQRSIENNKESKANAERNLIEMDQNNPLDLATAERNVKEKEEALAKLKAGADELDIRAKKITLQQKEDGLSDAQQNLADYYIRAPFDGIITNLDIKKGESVSSGTALATLMTKQKIAEISLNEVDVAKIKVGQKTTLVFDAVSGLSITGEVAEIDSIGAVSQGVVTYSVKIVFVDQDERVKSSMSVSAAIIIEAKPNALLVPNSAIKSQGDIQYVEIAEGKNTNTASAANASGIIIKNQLRRQIIEAGLANDEFTEIINGLQEGDIIVTRAIQPNSTQSRTQQQSNSFRMPGLSGGGGR